MKTKFWGYARQRTGRDSIFLDFGFWRDFGFSPQEGFGEECGRNFWMVFHNFLNNVNIIIQYTA